MHAATDNSIVLAEILGIVFFVSGLGVFLRRKSIGHAIDAVADNAGLLWIWGFVNLLFGAVIVALQNAWTPHWTILIPICGWAALVKGVWIILLPDSANVVYHKCHTPGIFAFGGIVGIILGIVLLYLSLGR